MRFPNKRLMLKLLLVFLTIWIIFDVFVPHHSSFREFDPVTVAKLETDMWRSYYNRRPLALFWQLSCLLRTQYHLPLLKSGYVSYEATRAAFVFKKGRGRKDYEKALPYLVKYYRIIRNSGDIPFNVERVAKLELEWWIVHRERKKHRPGDLDSALADVQSELYEMPSAVFMKHARLRAEAMTLRDNRAESKAVTNQDWQRINQLLDVSWQSLWKAVQKD